MRSAAIALTVVLAAVLFWNDQRSLEHGNRLFRSGDPVSASAVYERLDGAEYNLGTAMLGLDPDSAAVFLRRGTESSDAATRQRSFYNLGYRLLALGQGPLARDSAAVVLSLAVEANRTAFLLDPSDQDARWNMVLAQRQLDALVPPGDEVGRESGGESDDEVASNDQQMARSENAEAESGEEPEDPQAADNSGERQGPREGAREAWASQDPGPMSRGDAFDLLATVQDDAETLIRGILWSRRPDVAWWANQPYPGGPW